MYFLFKYGFNSVLYNFGLCHSSFFVCFVNIIRHLKHFIMVKINTRNSRAVPFDSEFNQNIWFVKKCVLIKKSF